MTLTQTYLTCTNHDNECSTDRTQAFLTSFSDKSTRWHYVQREYEVRKGVLTVVIGYQGKDDYCKWNRCSARPWFVHQLGRAWRTACIVIPVKICDVFLDRHGNLLVSVGRRVWKERLTDAIINNTLQRPWIRPQDSLRELDRTAMPSGSSWSWRLPSIITAPDQSLAITIAVWTSSGDHRGRWPKSSALEAEVLNFRCILTV